MFELNLIKDKARARQRRKIIFMTISMVCLMAGLCSLFVVSLYIKELNDTNRFAREAQSKEAEFNAKKLENDTNDPIFRKRRNEVIKAWNEDVEFLNKRPYYSPVLKVLSTEKPGAPYWFTSIEFVTLTQGQPGVASTGVPGASATPRMMLPRGLRISGMIAIVESDVRTEQALKRFDERMNDRDGFVALVGPAQSRLSDSAKGQVGGGQGGGESRRWNEFSIASTNSSGNYGP